MTIGVVVGACDGWPAEAFAVGDDEDGRGGSVESGVGEGVNTAPRTPMPGPEPTAMLRARTEIAMTRMPAAIAAPRSIRRRSQDGRRSGPPSLAGEATKENPQLGQAPSASAQLQRHE